jgi:hypothetical protein
LALNHISEKMTEFFSLLNLVGQWASIHVSEKNIKHFSLSNQGYQVARDNMLDKLLVDQQIQPVEPDSPVGTEPHGGQSSYSVLRRQALCVSACVRLPKGHAGGIRNLHAVKID